MTNRSPRRLPLNEPSAAAPAASPGALELRSLHLGIPTIVLHLHTQLLEYQHEPVIFRFELIVDNQAAALNGRLATY